jgi:hypothetical protein
MVRTAVIVPIVFAILAAWAPAVQGRVLCDFEGEADAKTRWQCFHGTMGVQKSIVHGGEKAALWVAKKGFSHLHLRGLDPGFGSRSLITLWVWCDKPLPKGLLLGVGQSTKTFAVAPLPLRTRGWNGFSIPVLRMAARGAMDWDLVALFALVYVGEEERSFAVDDIALQAPESPSRARNPRHDIQVDPKAERFVLSDFEKKGDDSHVYFERSAGGKVSAPSPVRNGKCAYRWTLDGNRPFIHFGSVPKDLSSFVVFNGSLYFQGDGSLSLHILFCTTDADNYQEEILLPAGRWTDVSVYLSDMLPIQQPDWRNIRAVVFTIGGRAKGTVYFDDLVLSRKDPADEGEGEKE